MTAKNRTRSRTSGGGGRKWKVKNPRFSGVSIVTIKGGKIPATVVAKVLGMSKAQLAQTAGVSVETLYRTDRAGSAKTQARLKEMLEIVDRVSDWAGGKDQAVAWYRAEPLPEFGGRTAESLVKDGKAADVRDYLDHVALGGFA
jgi:uncharacterized protein (DUF2384 family)